MQRFFLGTVIAVTLLLASLAAIASTTPRPSRPALASASLSKSVGFINCAPQSDTVTVSRESRPAILARIQARLPAAIPPSTSMIPPPDAGSAGLVLVFRDGHRRHYLNDTPASLRPIVAILAPLVHLCTRPAALLP
jgi:hypothetical protein